MSSIFWRSISISPIFLGIFLSLITDVMAAPKGSVTNKPAAITGTANDLILNKASGVKSVQIAAGEPSTSATESTTENELATDPVQPSDWRYTALKGVAAKYGCNSNLNNQPVSQLDFARTLNTCLVKIEPMLAQQPSTSPSLPSTAPTRVTAADLEVIKRLTQEFRAQLTEVDGRVTSADKKITQLQASQFSTTTKLKGEAIFNITGALSGSNSNNLVLGDRVRLLFETSFNGKDRLWTRLATGNQPGANSTLTNNVPGFPNTAEGGQVSESNGNNSVGVDWLAYQFPVGSTNVYTPAFGGLHVDYAPSYSPNFEDFTGGNGALSNFAESSPIYKIGGGAGIGTNIPISENGLKSVTVGYLSGSANSPTAGQGLFGGDNALLGQLNFKLGDKLEAGLTYVSSYHTGTKPIYAFGGGGGLTGTSAANINVSGTKANSYGAEVSYKASDTLSLNGFALNTKANKDTLGNQDIWSYGAGISLPNVDGKGSLIGLLIGAEPYVGGLGSTPLHFEGFYKYKVSDNLSVTPGLIYLTSPNQISGNNALIGVVRTTFTF